MGKEFIVNNLDDMCALMCDNNTEGLEVNNMSKVILKVEVEEDYLKSIMANTNKTSSDIILINATPLTERDDCVSKASVFEIMGNLLSIPYDFDRFITENDVSQSMDKIRALPSVPPKCEQGEWIEEFNDIEREVRFTCSSCGEYQLFETDFCPNCGAEMR